MTAVDRLVEDVTCLGCGCACDDIAVRVEDGRIVETRNACPLGAAWFGDGLVPSRALVAGRDASVDEALAAAAALLSNADAPLVYLAPDISCDAQREAVALADLLHAVLDSITSATALPSLLASQERGRAGATLGEVANRADLVVCWGVDPDARYPRFRTRYGPERAGLHVPEGRRSRTLVAVDVGASRGPADADVRYAIGPESETAAAAWLRRAVVTEDVAAGDAAAVDTMPGGALEGMARALASTLRSARYAAVIADAEPDDLEPGRDPRRADALTSLTQVLNDVTRCALILLRGGGNRSGADAVLTSQTGYPVGIDFSRGFPAYRPFDAAAARLARGEPDAVVVLGSVAAMPADLVRSVAPLPVVTIGPRATVSALAAGVAAIDTAVAGVHEAGLALRMDDVPLPLRAVLSGPPATKAIARALRERIVAVRRRAAPR